MSEHGRDLLYRNLLRHALLRLVPLYFVPLLLLAAFFVTQTRSFLSESHRRHLTALVEQQAATLDMFLSERRLNLTNAVDDPRFLIAPDDSVLAGRLDELQRANDAFVDLSVLSMDGQVLAYAGPHPDLHQRNYAGEKWFADLDAGAPFTLTDIYLGFRDRPHFTMGLRVETGGVSRVLRAALSPERIRAHVATLEGAGEVHVALVNDRGVFQVVSPQLGEPLTRADFVPPRDQRRGCLEVEASETTVEYAWTWLGTLPWALIATDAGSRSAARLGAVSTITLLTLLFCLLGAAAIWIHARWVAGQQWEAQNKERDLSRQLVHAAKLASVGELAGGIAHEINNPLAIVAEEAGLMSDLLDPRFGRDPTVEDLQGHLATIRKAVFRCTDITRQLLGFVRQSEVRLVRRDVHALIDDLADGFLGPELAVADISVVKDYDPGLPEIITDPNQLRQVVLNLLKNAADAIDDDGIITITTRRRGDRFTLEVRDDGCGMTPEQLEKVFMPFFTTKDPGRGTGLGLSVSYGIVEGLGGGMTVESASGAGSIFTIELPLER